MGTLKVTQVIMKVLFISAILAVASAGFAPTCDECNAAAQGLLERLTSAESIADRPGSSSPKFALRLPMQLPARRHSPNTGATWRDASTLLSSEPATLASASVFAR